MPIDSPTPSSPPPRGIRRYATWLVPALADFLILSSGLYFGIVRSAPPFLAVAAFAVVRNRFPRVKRNPLTWIVYAVLVLNTLDEIAQVSLMTIRAGPPYAIALAALPVGGLVIGRRRWLGLDEFQGFLLALGVTSFVLSSALVASPSSAACERARRSDSVHLLVDFGKGGGAGKIDLPRFLALDSSGSTLFVGYRHRVLPELGGRVRSAVDVVKVDEGSFVPVDLGLAETIGMAVDPATENLVALLAEGPRSGGAAEQRLVWIDAAGKIVRSVPLPWGKWHDYYGGLVFREGRTYLLTGPDDIWLVEPDGRLVREPRSRNRPETKFRALNAHLLVGHSVVKALAGSPLKARDSSALLVFDLESWTYTASHWDRWMGNYTLAYDPEKKEILTNALWTGTVDILDLELKPVRSFDLGGVIRAIAVDGPRRIGYVSDYVGGGLTAFDLDSGDRLGSTWTGRGARAIAVSARGRVFAGSGCGVMEILAEKLAPSRFAKTDPAPGR